MRRISTVVLLRRRGHGTSLIAKHTGLISNSAYSLVKKISHSSKFDLTEFSTAVNYLTIHPHLEARELRNLLEDFMPSYFLIDYTFLNNFRHRVDVDHAKHPGSSNLTHDVATHLTKRCNLKPYEIEELEDPLIMNKLRSMYKHIMSKNPNTWQVLSYLQKYKGRIVGFDYIVQHSPDGRPIVIMWMTPIMRTNLLRYSHILFLHCQER